jgi:hypothetical protein
MRHENMAPGGSSLTAFEESCHIPSLVNGYTDLLLKHAGSIARALNEQRIAEGREWIAKVFHTNDNPSGFFVRVTSHEARWFVPMWEDDSAFDAAQVNYCRATDPRDYATRPV